MYFSDAGSTENYEIPKNLPKNLNAALIKLLRFEPTGGDQAIAGLGRSLKLLWPVLARERGRGDLSGGHYSMRSDMALSYAAYYLPANVLKIPLILAEAAAMKLPLALLGGEGEGNINWVDFGCGPGTAIFGAWSFLRPRFNGHLRFWGWDQSPEFLALGRRLGGLVLEGEYEEGEYKPQSKTTFDWQPFSYESAQRTIARLREVNPSVISFSNSLSEFGGDPEIRAQWIVSMIDFLKELSDKDGRPRWIIIVEPGSRVASRDLLLLRQRVIEASKEGSRNGQGVHILLPCLNDRPCGAFEDVKDWCHEEHGFKAPAWHEKLGALAGLKKEQLLFSYLVMAVGGQDLSQSLKAWPAEASRVVSQRMVEKGLVKCFLCTTQGKRMARVLDSRRTPENEAMVHAQRGQKFLSVNLDEKGSVIACQTLE